MADINFDVKILGKEAIRFVKDLVVALGQLKQANRDASNSGAAAASKAELASLQQRLAAAKQFLANKQQEADAIKQVNDRMIADANRTADAMLAATKRQNAANLAGAESAKEAAKTSAASTATAVAQQIANQKALVAAVEEGVRIRIQRQKDVAALDAKTSATTIENLQKTLANMRKARQEEQDINKQRVKDAKDAIKAAKEAAASPQFIKDDKTDRFRDRATGRIVSNAVAQQEKEAGEQRIRDRQKELDAARDQAKTDDEAAARRIARQKEIVAAEKKASSDRAADQQASLSRIEAIGKKEIAEKEQEAAVVVAAEKRKEKAANESANAAEKNVGKVEAANKKNEAAAIKAGNTVVSSSKKQATQETAAANTRVKNANTTVNALNKQTAAAQKAADLQTKAFSKTSAAMAAHAKQFPIISSGIQGLRRAVTQLVAAYAGFRSLLKFVGAGLEFNQIIESSKLGIAALITAEADLVDQQGRLLKGTDALAAAQGLAGEQLDKLRIAGLQTSATTKELVQSFQEAVGAGISVGLTLDQIRKFSVSVAQAASAINLPMNQLQQETRSILQGTIDRNSRIAKALNLTNAQVNLAKQQGRLFDLLNEKFAAFNIAGVESVKTFSALKSNIKDAFSVFAGISVQPFFEQLRDAGQEALSRIFDFKTADIQRNFRGLIEALQEIFRQVGQVFGLTIRNAVDRAEELSKWLQKNKDEVRKTAAAISTMVLEFIKMIGAIAQGIGDILTFGDHVNTVAGAARTLSLIFQAIAENVKVIVALLTARALISAIGSIIAAVGALSSAATGAEIGTAIGGPLVGAIGGTLGLILGLRTALKLYKGDAQNARLETARLGNVMVEQQLRGAKLIDTLIDLDRTIKDMKKTNQDTTEAEQQRAAVEEELRSLGPAYQKALDSGTGSLEERRKKLIDVIQQQRIFAAYQLAAAQSEGRRLEAERAKIASQKPVQRTDFLADGTRIITDNSKEIQKQLGVIDDQLEVNRQQVLTTGAAYRDLAKASEEVTRGPVKLRPPPTTDVQGEAPVIREAKARFEAMKAELDVQRAKTDELFAKREISASEHLHRLLAIDLQEIEGERGLIQAQIVEAERKKKIAENKGKQGRQEAQAQEDEVRALNVQLAALDAKRIRTITESDTQLVQSSEETARKRLEIEQGFLEASGKHLEAARLEIFAKQESALRDAIREFGGAELQVAAAKIAPGDVAGLQKLIKDLGDKAPTLVLHASVALDNEALQAQLKAAEEQIQKVEEQRNREVEGIKSHFKSLGKLSTQQQQDQATAISQANERASKAVESLRSVLVQLRGEATDPAVIIFIDTLIDRLDLLKAQSKEVNLEMQKLQQGFSDALEGGLADFFQSIGDGSKGAASAFKEMAKSIIDDMRRIISQIIASRITTAILTAIGGAAKSGGQAGNLTQSQGRADGGVVLLQRRAAGGLGRPPHGVLHGGIQGKDSIGIAAMPEEYFVRREATKKYGSDLFDLFNEMRVPLSMARELFTLMHHHIAPPVLRQRPRFNFAQGGIVGRATSSARPPMNQTEHTITVDADGLLRFLTGSKGRDITLSHVGSSPRFVHSTIQKRLKLR